MNYYIEIGIKITVAVAAAIIFGNGIVVMFNRLPVRWFEEDGVIPPALADAGDGSRQRLPSTPWKYIFTGFFLASGIYLAISGGVQYEIAVLCVFAIVLMMAVCDAKYMIVPDQFQILLAISALGFITFYDEWWEQLAGAGIGIVLNLLIYGLGRLIYKRDTIGGADIKFFACIGLAAGRSGVIWIFMITVAASALHAAYQLAARQAKAGEARPLIPYAFVGVMVYYLFVWNFPGVMLMR